MDIKFSPEATAEHLRGLQASADLIGKIAAGADLDPYQAAIVAGKGWLAAS